jgi:hypothetical protein
MYWSATHESELIELDSTGMPLGCDETGMEDPPGPPLRLEPGGMLFVFSDGIYEAFDPNGQCFDTDRTKAIINRMRTSPAGDITEAVWKEVHRWQCKPIPNDDQTIVIVRRTAQAAASEAADTDRAMSGQRPDSSDGVPYSHQPDPAAHSPEPSTEIADARV